MGAIALNTVSNKCRCCGNEMGTSPFCDICGMTPISVTSGDTSLERVIKEYISKMLGNTELKLRYYTYTVDESGISEPSDSYSTICMGSRYWVGEKVFSDIVFEELPSSSEMEISLRISDGKKSRDETITVSPGKEISHSRLGVEFMPKLRARLVLGNDDNSVYSEEFSLI